jgi:hypothetical protein
VYNTRGRKYSLDAPDDERKYRSKHIEQPRNNKLSYTLLYFWSFSYIKRKILILKIPERGKMPIHGSGISSLIVR